MSAYKDRPSNDVATAAIFRFHEAMKSEAGLRWDVTSDIPFTPENVTTIPIAEQGRRQVLKEITLKVSKIHDAALEDFQIRALNDEINELVKQKKAWDFRIRQLGGFHQRLNERYEDMGTEGPLGDGYYYFGRAKELPGIKQVLAEITATKRGEKVESQGEKDQRENLKLRQSLLDRVDAEYFGYENKEDLTEDEGDEVASFLPSAPYPVPSIIEIETYLVEKRKASLLEYLEKNT